MKQKRNHTRKETRDSLNQHKLALELTRVIRHSFPTLLPQLRQLSDHRHQSHVTYPVSVLLMTRILSSLCYIRSMRKTSEEFNSEQAIDNIWAICGEEQTVKELPYWETVNRYLKGLMPQELQKVIQNVVRRLLRSRAFEAAKIRGKYWQIIVDGTQLYRSREALDKKSLYCVHNKGTEEEYRENYYYVLEAKLVLHPGIVVSLATEFVENEEGEEAEKQDCERKACWRLMRRLKKEFPRLPICLSADSLYACEGFFRRCEESHWKYLLRFKEGSIPSVGEEYQKLKKLQRNLRSNKEDGYWYDFVTDLDYEGHPLQVFEYAEAKAEGDSHFMFLTNLPLQHKNVLETVKRGRMRWKIENEGFNTQKRQGYYLEHPYSKDYPALKNHYYLIQISHMLAQVMEAWSSLWSGIRQSLEQKHRRLLESLKQVVLTDCMEELERRVQIRFE